MSMRRCVASIAVMSGCGASTPAPMTEPSPGAATAEPVLAEVPSTPRSPARIQDCDSQATVTQGGRPFSDDLSGAELRQGGTDDQTVLWVHTDSAMKESRLHALDFVSGKKLLTVTLPVAQIDPEDLAVDRGTSPPVIYYGGIGDNRAGGKCVTYERLEGAPGQCRLVGGAPAVRSKAECLEQVGRIWLHKTFDHPREQPYAIWRFVEPSGPGEVAELAELRWSNYPTDDQGRCGGVACGGLAMIPSQELGPGPNGWNVGRFNAEALFVRHETYADGSEGTSAYVVTKALYPLTVELAAQRGDRCAFGEDGRAHVFRIPHAEKVRGATDVTNRLEHMALLHLGVGGLNPTDDERLSVRITAAAFDDEDLVFVTRRSSYRWHVPASRCGARSVVFSTRPPPVVSPCRRSTTPRRSKGSRWALEQTTGLAPTSPLANEGDRGLAGPQSAHRLTQIWPRSEPTRAQKQHDTKAQRLGALPDTNLGRHGR